MIYLARVSRWSRANLRGGVANEITYATRFSVRYQMWYSTEGDLADVARICTQESWP